MTISIIIPVYKEEKIGHVLDFVRAMFGSLSPEVIVVDGDPACTTIVAMNDPGVVQLSSEKGRGMQLHRGAMAASGELLLFLHADTVLPESACMRLTRLFDQYGDHLCGAFDLQFDSKKPVYRWFEKVTSIRSRLTRIPYGDQAIFISKKLYEKCGGFRPFPLMEDVDFMRRLKKMGVRLQFIDAPVTTSVRKWEQHGIWKNTIHNWGLLFQYYWGVSPDRLYERYYGEKLGDD